MNVDEIEDIINIVLIGLNFIQVTLNYPSFCTFY